MIDRYKQLYHKEAPRVNEEFSVNPWGGGDSRAFFVVAIPQAFFRAGCTRFSKRKSVRTMNQTLTLRVCGLAAVLICGFNSMCSAGTLLYDDFDEFPGRTLQSSQWTFVDPTERPMSMLPPPVTRTRASLFCPFALHSIGQAILIICLRDLFEHDF